MGIARELAALPRVPQGFAQAVEEGDTTLQDIGNVAALPGVRLIPGSFIVQNLLGGQDVTTEGSQEGSPTELARHPLFTALDVLPIAQGAARRTPAVRAIEAYRQQAGTLAKGERVARPLTELLMRRVDEGGITPTRSGEVIGHGMEAFGRTKPGQLAQQAWGQQSRALSSMVSRYTERLHGQMNPAMIERHADDPLARLYTEAETMAQRYEDISPDRQREIGRIVQEEPEQIPSFIGREGEFVNEVRDLTEKFLPEGIKRGELATVEMFGSPEVYDIKTASTIQKVRNQRGVVADVSRYRNVAAGSDPTVDPASILEDLNAPLSREAFKPADRLRLAEARIYALGRHGYEINPLLKSLAEARRRGGDSGVQLLGDSIEAWRASDSTATPIRPARPIEGPLPGVDRKIRAYLNRTDRNYGEKRMRNLTRRQSRVEGMAAPARFQPVIQRETRRAVKEHLDNEYRFNPDADLDEMMRLADEGNFDLIPGLEKTEYRRIQRGIIQTWSEMKRDGVDPIFVHHVSPTAARRLNYPRILERLETPTQIRKRTNDMSPTFNDIGVSLRHQGMEWLSRRGTEEFINEFGATYGRTERALREEYLPAARKAAEIDPRLDVGGHLEQMINREWESYNPESFVTWQSPNLTQYREGIRIPKNLAANMKRMHTPASNRLTAVLDPIMNVFRTSLLPLSPRWQLYNIVGGGVMTMARTNPIAIVQYFREAMDMVKNQRLPEGLPRGGMVSAPRETVEWMHRASLTEKIGASYNFLGGATMRRILDSTQKVRDAGGNLVQKSYNWNGMVDDFYRSIAYLYGTDKALTKGMTRDAAQQQGISLVRKVMQSWDEATPIERSVMRYVFPFYGWMQHIMRYTMSYPFDHPIRTAITASFARNELEDMGDALPERFMNMFFVGSPGLDGKVTGINVAGMNPFSDVANYFTLAGFMGQMNPLISTMLQSVGVDPMSGGPELYPNLRYSPETGRLTADTGNPLTNLVGNIVPQSRVLMQLSGRSAEFRQLLRTNPDAARRMLQSEMGIPIIARDVNVPEEIFKAELSRIEAQDTALNRGLKTGNLSQANQFPGLQAYLDQIQALQSSGQLADYEAPNDMPGLQTLLNPLP